jgi:ATP-dependent helicase/DNAse subunit B
VEDRAREELAPAIPRVWEDGIAALRADLREWLRRLVDDPWVPTYFELSFGLSNDDRARDPRSVDAPVALDCGLQLRGSIDVVDVQGDRVRATDHKTGKAHMKRGAVVAGGAALQPVLYALVLEKLLPDARVEGGRLYHCTHNAEFKELPVALDDDARHGAQAVADTLAHHLEQGFFPAMPEERACAFCDYQSVCGPHEERRTQRKDRARLHVLQQLRERP